MAENEARTGDENIVVEGEAVDVDNLRQQIIDKDGQIFILTEMLTEYQAKHANEELTAANLRASLKLERERSTKNAPTQDDK